MDTKEYLDKVYRYLMDKYNYSPNDIDQMDFFRTSDLVFNEVYENKEAKEKVYYADEISW